MPVGEDHHVVPVPANVCGALAGDIPGGEGKAWGLGKTIRQQATLQRLHEPALALIASRVVDCDGSAFGAQGEHRHVVIAEATSIARAEEQDAEGLCPVGEPSRDQRAQPARREHAEQVVALVEFRQAEGRAVEDRAEEPSVCGQAQRLRGGRQPAARGERHLARAVVPQEQAPRVGSEHARRPVDDVGQEVLDLEVGERRIGDALQLAHSARDGLGLGSRLGLVHALGALALQLDEHAHLAAQHIRVEWLDDVVDGSAGIGMGDQLDVRAVGR